MTSNQAAVVRTTLPPLLATRIAGIGPVAAVSIIAQTGVAMTRFPTAGQLG